MQEGSLIFPVNHSGWLRGENATRGPLNQPPLILTDSGDSSPLFSTFVMLFLMAEILRLLQRDRNEIDPFRIDYPLSYFLRGSADRQSRKEERDLLPEPGVESQQPQTQGQAT